MKTVMVALAVLAHVVLAQGANPSSKPARPKIFGIAHYATRVTDLEQARAFYTGFLGFAEPFCLKNPDGAVTMAFIKVNDYQYIELTPGLKPDEDRLNHISFFTDDAEAMRRYLQASEIQVPERVPKGRSGNLNFTIKDPEGHTVEIVQYMPDSWPMREKGKFLPVSRVSQHIGHIGVISGDANAAKRFYVDILGFQETWRGSGAGSSTVSWINLRVPDGTDYLELMLYKYPPAPNRRGTVHHICLETPHIGETLEKLKASEYGVTYGKPLEIRTGINRRRQLNVFDPDGTRTEFMEAFTVDGSAPPPSTAPLPR